MEVPIPDPASLPLILTNSPHWILWKAERRADKIAKIPCDSAGETASMKENHLSLDAAISAAERLRSLYSCRLFGVGLAFSDDMGFVGVDLDSALINAERADHLNWLLNDHATWAEFSISGRGVHLFYAGSFGGKRFAKVEQKTLEIFGTKGFIAVTGNVIHSGPIADFGPVAMALDPFIERKTYLPADVFFPNGNHTLSVGNSYGQAALDNQCNRVRSAAKGTLHFTLSSASCSLGRLIPTYLGQDEAETALYQAAVEAGAVDLTNAAKTIRGQIEFGMTSPAHPQERFSTNGHVDLTEFGKEELFEEGAPSIEDPGPFPQCLLAVPGFIAQVTQYTNEQSNILQPILSLAGALSLMAVLTGRKVRDASGIRTNVYILGVAGSGEGKESARQTNKKILFASGASSLVGAESWASGPGLLKAVETSPAVLFQNDEIGRFLQTTNNAKSSPHLSSVISILLKLYSSSSNVFLGDAYADGRQSTIQQPNAVLYGTTVPGNLYAALTEDSVTGGLMGRVFVFEAPKDRQPLQYPIEAEPPESIVEIARQWFNWHPTPGNLTSISPVPFVVPVDPEAESIYREFGIQSRDRRAGMGDVIGSLWARALEQAKKLALLYACSERFGFEARITSAAATWAVSLTKYLVARQCWQVHQWVSRNKVESESLEVERIIREAGSGGITGKTLLRMTRSLTKKDRAEAIQYLIDCEKVELVAVKGAGRPTNVYRVKVS